MATITITIPDSVVARVVDALGTHYGYQAIIDGAPNPETKARFVQRMIRTHIKNIVREQEASVASQSAFVSTSTAVDSEIVLS